MHKVFGFILDFFFPLSKEAEALRALSPEEAYEKLPRTTEKSLPFVTSLFSYKDPLVKELVLSVKNKKNKHAFECAAYALSKNVPEKSILVPIPISRKRRNERGYNQCELLIDEMMKLGNFENNFNLLVRAKDRGEQKTKNREERLISTTNIFTVNFVPMTLPIVIIDDVCTTGSTLKEAREALLSAGYSDVRALTLAH